MHARPALTVVVTHLTRDELLAAADRLGVALPERRAKDPIVAAFATAPGITIEGALADLKRDRLKELCRAVGIDDSGKEKAEIIARLAGRTRTASADQLGLGLGAVRDDLPLANPPRPFDDVVGTRRGRPPKALADAVATLNAAPLTVVPSGNAPRRGRPPKSAATPSSTAAPSPDEIAHQVHDAQLAGKLTREQLERYLWAAADILRGSIDSSDYKSFIFGLLFLKRLSDRFDEECEVAWSCVV